jgi:(2R)-3-sulfolactate dehydrogenase (NADP+)
VNSARCAAAVCYRSRVFDSPTVMEFDDEGLEAMARLTLDEIEELSFGAFSRSGASEPQARLMAVSMREAEAEGIRNVGLSYLPTYCLHLQCGKVDGTAIPVVHPADGSILRVDAAGGFCHPAFWCALEPFVDLVTAQGIAFMTITRSNSAGVVGWFNDVLARRGLVSLAFANASPSQAGWGGRTPFFGTNPLGFGSPRRNGAPIVVDMATTTTARVNVWHALNEGRSIPDTWALDPEGRPTTDPTAGLAGSIAPLGGAKGYGLALMVEILAAGLTGGDWSYETSSFGDDQGSPILVGQSFVAIDAARCAPGFLDRIETMIGLLLADEGVRLPGHRRHECRAMAETAGVEVPDEMVADINALGR